jgi:hypothetical protein
VKVKLTKDNLDIVKSIETHTLPENFRDAVVITRQLGVRYVWIDSLCIVQDDALEWEVQSTKMGLVYANARCVISATASKDSAGGCFLPRVLRYNDCKYGNGFLVVRSLQAPTLPHLFEFTVDKASLKQRAWAFQERYLASRTLHFCDGFVLFECNTLTASEYDKNGREYPAKPYVRSDGKLHAQSDVEDVERDVERYMTKPFEVAVRSKRPYYWSKRAKVNPLYLAKQKKAAEMFEASARRGVRGAFESLWHFKGEMLEEMIEFHNS